MLNFAKEYKKKPDETWEVIRTFVQLRWGAVCLAYTTLPQWIHSPDSDSGRGLMSHLMRWYLDMEQIWLEWQWVIG